MSLGTVQSAERCYRCGGHGWIAETGSEHHWRCDGSCYLGLCPVPVQTQEQCPDCCGSGTFPRSERTDHQPTSPSETGNPAESTSEEAGAAKADGVDLNAPGRPPSWHPGGRCGCAECVEILSYYEAVVAEREADRVETLRGSRPMSWSERQKARREAGE